MSRFLPSVVAAMFVLPVTAHEGEDHGAAAAATGLAVEIGPRAATATELFELVAVASGDHLTLYLDRFATNEPVSGAKIEIDQGAATTIARELEAGVYQASAGEWRQSGPHALTIAVQAGEDADLLSITVEAPAQDAGVSSTSSSFGDSASRAWRSPLVWGASGVVLLTAAGVVALRREGAESSSKETRRDDFEPSASAAAFARSRIDSRRRLRRSVRGRP
ncbi:MAG: hypothetical protein LT102_08035 [Burkholderiaceae bacterium]|nr:hypothetical protein [Burkholderiaceae bacterium]